MKKQFELEDYVHGKYVMYCPDEESIETFVEFLLDHGKRIDTTNALHFIRFTNFRPYSFDIASSSDCARAYTENGAIILNFRDFKWKDTWGDSEQDMEFFIKNLRR